MRKLLYNLFILVGLFFSPLSHAQIVLETLEGEIPFTPSAKCLERVYDRNYGDGDHNFIYCAVKGPNGKKWLNLNLGAEYAKESSPYFNPEAEPTDYNDWKAFGSLFQYGRKADGHELMKYFHRDIDNNPYNLTDDYWWVEPVNGITEFPQDYENSNQKYYMDFQGGSWTSEPSYRYWNSKLYKNNPCPIGYRIIVAEDVDNLIGDDESNLDLTNKGEYTTTSIIKNKNYNSLNLMLSPTVINKINSKYYRNLLKTESARGPHGTGYTSGLWILPLEPVYRILSYMSEYFFKNFETSNFFINYLYRGSYTYRDGYKVTSVWKMGYIQGETMGAAIRCIEE